MTTKNDPVTEKTANYEKKKSILDLNIKDKFQVKSNDDGTIDVQFTDTCSNAD